MSVNVTCMNILIKSVRENFRGRVDLRLQDQQMIIQRLIITWWFAISNQVPFYGQPGS